jgi:hypothetical protein
MVFVGLKWNCCFPVLCALFVSGAECGRVQWFRCRELLLCTVSSAFRRFGVGVFRAVGIC